MTVSDSRIRVLLTVPHLNSTASPYREMIAIAKYLPQDEFSLTICSLRKNGISETGPVLDTMNIPYFVARFRPRGYTLKQIRQSLADQALINQSGPFDIQHSLDFTSSPFEALLARFHRRLFVYSQRNLHPNGHKQALRIKATATHRIIAVSKAVEAFPHSHGVTSSKIQHVPLGIDLSTMTYGTEKADKPTRRVLSVGHIVSLKRQEVAIRAVALLANTMPNIRLDIAGAVTDQRYYEELQSLVRETGLSERVRFLGLRDDVPDLMRQADVLVLCSESEAFGWVILEAMSVGLPAVASAVDGPKTIIDDGCNGLLVPVGDVEGYAQAISSVLTNSALAAELATNGRRLVEERYSAERMVQQIADLYRDVVQQR